MEKKTRYNSAIKGSGISTTEIGDLLGISSNRVSQIIISALKKMRKEFKKRGITLKDLGLS